MKNIKYVLVALILMFALTGCARLNIDITIKENGKVDCEMLCAVIEDFANDSDMPSDDEIADLERDGWVYTPYSQEGYVGYTMTIKDKDLNDMFDSVGSAESGLGLNDDTFIIRKDGSKYIFDAKLFDDSDASEISAYKTYINLYDGYMKLVLHVPEPAISSNATSVSEDGKTLTWDLLSADPSQSLHAEFKVKSFNSGILIGIIVILAVALGVLIYMKKKGNRVQVVAGGNMNLPPVQMSSPTQVNNTGNTIFCSQCGAKIAANAAFCPQCGKKM